MNRPVSDHPLSAEDRAAAAGGARSAPESRLVSAVEDSKQLLDYCLRHGRPVTKEVIGTLVEASHDMAALRDPATEVRFWEAFGVVSKAAAPATPESLRFGVSFWRTHFTTIIGWIAALFALVLVVALQSYWVVGTSLLGDVSKHRGEYDAIVKSIIEQRREPAVLLDQAEAGTRVQRIETLYHELRQVNARLQTGMDSLHHWNRAWGVVSAALWSTPPFMSEEYTVLSNYGKALVNADNAELFLRILYSYILPMLYGILGACVYVVRESASDIRACTFTYESVTYYLSRVVLGPIAGVAMGWLLTPDQPAASETGALRALGLPVLAFVAGYSVNILFILMDRIIYAFSSGESSAPRRDAKE